MGWLDNIRISHGENLDISAAGPIGDVLKGTSRSLLHVVVKNVGPSNVIEIKAKISKNSTYQTIKTITGTTTGTLVDVFKWDDVFLECTTFDPSGDAELVYGLYAFTPSVEVIEALNQIINLLGGQVQGSNSDFFTQETSNQGSLQTYMNVSVPSGSTRKLFEAKVRFRHPAYWELKSDGAIIASGWNGPANYESNFVWRNVKDIAENTNLTLEFFQVSGPSGQKIEIYVHSTDVNN